MIPKECKRLAEIDFPIAEVSRHAAREKSIRHGHPSTLHLWWARRPLASYRAVLLGLLLPDPCDPHWPREFKGRAAKANLEFARLVAEEGQAGRPLGLDELLLLNHLWLERRLTTEDGARLIQKPTPEARACLNRFVESGLAEPRGERKGRVRHLSAATYRRLGERAAYVRQRGFEPLQLEQMVLQYVEKHGRVTRREAAELCRLSGPQAYRMLQRLVDKGDIRQVGRRGRGVKNERESK